MVDAYETIVNNIKTIIREKGLKQCVVAKWSGFKESDFSNMLNNRKLLRVEHIISIAEALGVTPNELYL